MICTKEAKPTSTAIQIGSEFAGEQDDRVTWHSQGLEIVMESQAAYTEPGLQAGPCEAEMEPRPGLNIRSCASTSPLLDMTSTAPVVGIADNVLTVVSRTGQLATGSETQTRLLNRCFGGSRAEGI